MDFKSLKAASGKKSLEALTGELAKMNSYGDSDSRYWRPTRDKAGNGFAIIRFLPPPKDEDVPFIRQFRHDFKGPMGGVYRELSLTTLGQNDPVGELNSQLWNTGRDADKKQARDQKRKLSYISNIYIVNDSGAPENNGKVFLYKYGVKIFDKIQAKMAPEFEGEDSFNPYDFWEGANFKLRIKQVEEFPNYDSSEFAPQSKLFDDDTKLEEIWKNEYSLKELNDPKHFKSYNELKSQLHRVLGLDAPLGAVVYQPPTPVVIGQANNPPANTVHHAAHEKAPPALTEDKGVPFDEEGSEDLTSYFRKLAGK